jgi:hypothetical protein
MPENPLFKGLGEALGEIPLDSIKPSDGLETKKLDVATLASYNLLPKQHKTMIVPGRQTIFSFENDINRTRLSLYMETPKYTKRDQTRYRKVCHGSCTTQFSSVLSRATF